MPARILIVEDEALVAMELRFVLEDLGHEVVGTAADSEAAMKFAKETDVNLALVDIHLSDGPTGVTIGQELATDHNVAVLFMTANPGMVRNGVAGAIGVLSKPTEERIVQDAVAYALDLRSGHVRNMAPPQLQLFEHGTRA